MTTTGWPMIRCKTAGSEVADRTVICSALVHWRCGESGDLDAALPDSGSGAGAVRAVTAGACLNGGDGNPEADIAGAAARAVCAGAAGAGAMGAR
jgi:hypothetical protein